MTTPQQRFNDFKESFDKLDETQIAWLAGLFQAEASFGVDRRVRAQDTSNDYVPPPPAPTIKIDMIEKDVMETVGQYLNKEANHLTRGTTAGNAVYRVSLNSRPQIKYFLTRIRPYIIGEKTQSRIKEHLDLCEAHEKWETEGGRIAAAKRANKASQASKKAH